MTRKRLLPPRVRLVLGLVTSGLVLTATSGGSLGITASALLWAAPFLITMRCLPLPWALPLVFLLGLVARVVVASGDVASAALASAALLPLFLVDRLLEARLPRASLAWWPLALTALAGLASRASWGGLLAPAPGEGVLASLAASTGAWAVPLVTGLVGQAFGALGTVHNRPADRFDARVREAGVGFAAMVGIFLPTVVLAMTWVRAG